MTVTERVMQLGDWNLTLRPDTPKMVRDKIKGFGHIVVMPALVDAVDMSDAQLANARYTGVITRPGPYYRIGGHGLAMWLGTTDRAYGRLLAANAFVNAIMPSGVAFGTAVSTAISGCGLSVGTTTDPSGGTYFAAGTAWHYAKHRVALDAVCRFYNAEWRINPDGTLDAAAYDTLYPAPTTVVTRRPGGRVIGGVGVEALVDAASDLWEFASRVVLRGQTNVGAYGAEATVPTDAGGVYRAFDGYKLVAVAEQDAADLDGDLTFAATRLLPTLAHPHRTVTITTEAYDFAGDVPAGSRIYVYDPDNGVLTDPTLSSNAVEWQGEAIKPMSFRALGVTWPVEEGMSVFVRRHTGTSLFAGDLEYVDLTPFVQYETGSTKVEVGYDVSLTWSN